MGTRLVIWSRGDTALDSPAVYPSMAMEVALRRLCLPCQRSMPVLVGAREASTVEASPGMSGVQSGGRVAWQWTDEPLVTQI